MEARISISEQISPSSPIVVAAAGACFLCTAEYQLLEGNYSVVCEHCNRTTCASHRVTRRLETGSKATFCLKCHQRTYKAACLLWDRKEELRAKRRQERRLTKALLSQKEILERNQSRRISLVFNSSPVARSNQEKDRRGKIDLRITELKELIQTQRESNEALLKHFRDKNREIGQYREQEILSLKREITQIRAEIRSDLGTLRQNLALCKLSELLCSHCLRHFPHFSAFKPANSPRRKTPPPTPSTAATPTTQSCSSCHLI